MIRLLLLIVLSCGSIGLAACGRSSAPTLTNKIVEGPEWRAVLRDWYEGGISERHSCAAVVVASSHLPVDGGAIYSTIAADLARYAARVCTHHSNLAAVKRGMSNSDVAILAGAPSIPAAGSCWDYWSGTRDHTGTAICFRAGRVTSKSQVHHF